MKFQGVTPARRVRFHVSPGPAKTTSMPNLLPLDARVSVSGQLKADDMEKIAALGYAVVVNNRPDGEAWMGQPRTAELAQAAEQAGLAFVDLPFSGPGATPEQVRTLAGLLRDGDRRIVAYCKSGMRSTLLWGAASMANGKPLGEVLAAARGAGQDLDPLGEMMAALAAAART